MMRKSIYFTALFLLMLVTGVFWGTWFTLTRSLSDFQLPEFIHIGKVIIANVSGPMKLLMPACILFMVMSLWGYGRQSTASLYAGIAALVFLIGALFITLQVLVPIDNQIVTWTPTDAPADWTLTRTTWRLYHVARTVCSLLAFGCFSLLPLGGKAVRIS